MEYDHWSVARPVKTHGVAIVAVSDEWSPESTVHDPVATIAP